MEELTKKFLDSLAERNLVIKQHNDNIKKQQQAIEVQNDNISKQKEAMEKLMDRLTKSDNSSSTGQKLCEIAENEPNLNKVHEIAITAESQRLQYSDATEKCSVLDSSSNVTVNKIEQKPNW